MLRLASKPRTTESRNALRDAIVGRVPFTSSGALSAREADADTLHYTHTGLLGGDALTAYRAEHPTYVVFSYGTPIAWWSEEHGWNVPTVRYSVTTSNHQHTVRMAVK